MTSELHQIEALLHPPPPRPARGQAIAMTSTLSFALLCRQSAPPVNALLSFPIPHNATHVSFPGTAWPHRRTFLRFHLRRRTSWWRTPRDCQLEEHECQILLALCLGVGGHITRAFSILFFICTESQCSTKNWQQCHRCCCIYHWSNSIANCHECHADFGAGIGRVGQDVITS